MKLYVGITDNDWFKLHASKESLGEVNFWRPSHLPYRKDFQPGMPFLFKLHAPENAIVGGGFFLKFLALPLSLAWATLGEANGARTFEEFRTLISKRRTIPIRPNEDPIIGCTILGEPFFFNDSDWIPGERYLKGPIVSGKGNFDSDTALALWREVTPRLERSRAKTLGPATVAALDRPRYGLPALVAPRLGQGSFRALVTDAYQYRCAITLERTLPVLQAAHIRPYSEDGTHELSNGLLLRSDLHTLFDLKYMTIDPNDKRVIVSRRIREEFENGRAYYELMGRRLADPETELAGPSVENLKYHFDQFSRREGHVFG
jgi:putative restriction endonuclease